MRVGKSVLSIEEGVGYLAEACYHLGKSNDWVAQDMMVRIDELADILVERCKDLQGIEDVMNKINERHAEEEANGVRD